MPLIRLIFSVLFALCAATLPAYAHAAEELLIEPTAIPLDCQKTPAKCQVKAGQPEETLALNSPLTSETAPVATTASAPVAPAATAVTTEPTVIATPVVAEEPAPEWLPSARDVKIELIPEADLKAHDLWPRIRGGFAMGDLNSKLIAHHEKWYVDHPEYFARMTDRARLYLFYITEEVEHRGMPSEIALLPMIESAFNPGAYSRSRASGIWQFMPSTGKKFGMQQNWWYDGRRDVINATNGALDYLQKLHDMFGAWDLALAAYNCGEGAVQRAQAHNRKHHLPTNYASLKLLKETRNYVPKLLAIKNIIADPARFSLALQAIPNEPYFASIATPKHIDVKLAAQFADITEEEFVALNPAHNRPVILQGSNDLILLPIDRMETFRANLESYAKPLVSWQSYQPKKGDRLDQLAPRFGLSVENLKSVNGITAHGNISTGQTLLVPLNGEASASEFEAFNMQLVPTDSRSGTKHRVRSGETLGGLARRYHVSIAQLKQWNGTLKVIRVGQNIVIAQGGSSQTEGHRHKSKDRPRKVAQNDSNNS